MLLKSLLVDPGHLSSDVDLSIGCLALSDTASDSPDSMHQASEPHTGGYGMHKFRTPTEDPLRTPILVHCSFSNFSATTGLLSSHRMLQVPV